MSNTTTRNTASAIDAQTQHTPGPWELAERSGRSDSRLAAVLNDAESDAYIIISASDPDEESANARLIAAAPELLDALRQVVIEATESPNSDANRLELILELARAAIAKATGSAT
jgi:hypothetical protein